MRAAQLRLFLVHHVELAPSQGPAVGRREGAPRRLRTAPRGHGLGLGARGVEDVERAGIPREEGLGDPADHPIRLGLRLAGLEALPELGQEGELPAALLQLVGVALQLRMGLRQLGRQVDPRGDVDHRGEDEVPARRGQRRQADLGGELRAIAAAGGQLEAAAHGTGARMRGIGGAVGHVALGQARRHEALDRLAAELVRRPAERLLDIRAGIHDATVSVDGNDGVRARVEDCLDAQPEGWGDSPIRDHSVSWPQPRRGATRATSALLPIQAGCVA